VGTRANGKIPKLPPAVHPHARGDKVEDLRCQARITGSPPRAWGQGAPPLGAGLRGRFTPTRVGTRPSPTASATPVAVHPHARGDKQRRCSRAAPDVRFTPTRVGTSAAPRSARSCRSVHPHARGDKISDDDRAWMTSGSPPRAWGQALAGRVYNPQRRFTPTRVGTRRPASSRRAGRSVHPHARGDKLGDSGGSYQTGGSPPRAWGQGTAIARATP